MKGENRSSESIRFQLPKGRNAAFTIPELVIVLFTLLILFALYWPALTKTNSKPRIKCTSNLKNLGLSTRIFAIDHQDKPPWEVSRMDGGSLEDAENPMAIYRHFRALSNELATPKIVVCPNDKDRRVAKQFDQLDSNSCVSYCINLGKTNETGLLAGDRNIVSPERPSLSDSAIIRIHPGNENSFRLSPEIHNGTAHFVHFEGSVGTASDLKARELIAAESGRGILALPGD